MKSLIKMMKTREWLFLCLIVGLIVLQVWLELLLPDYTSQLLQYAMLGNSFSEIWKTGGLMLACALGSAAGNVIGCFLTAQIAATLSYRLREAVFTKVESFSMEEINKFSTSSLITRTTNDIQQIQMLVSMGTQMLIKAPVLAVWAICKILGTSWEWTVVVACAVIVMFLLFIVLLIVVMPKFKIVQKLTDNVNSVTRENLTGVRVVRAYNAESYQENKFEEANDRLTRTQLFTSRSMSIASPFITVLMSGVTLAIYWVGAYLIDALPTAMERVTMYSQMVTFSSYAMQIIMAFMMLAMIFVIAPRSMVSLQRVQEVLQTEVRIKEGTVSELPEGSPEGTVEFRNVSFRYPDAAGNMLENISFKAEKGQTVAFIGATGSGKSTVVNLIPRFYDATEGEVLVDGVNVKDYTFRALYDRIGYVSQKAVLFSGTVDDNVTYGEKTDLEYSEEAVRKAVGVAQGQEFVEKMDGTYQAHIAQGGTNVSGGQKQRLSIARAVYRNPEIFIFDDSFSALDYKTDRQLRKALKEETNGATSLIVAQRIGTIRDADLIIVLEDGRIAGKGTHDELMQSCTVYQEIALSQLSKSELEGQFARGGESNA